MKQDPAALRAYRAASAHEPGEVADRVRRFLPLVRRMAWHVYGAGRDGFELEDLMQTGLLALTECAARHNGPTEDGFAAYAKIRVRGAMVDCLRRSAHTSRGVRRQLALYEEAMRRLRARLKRAPDRAEIASEMGVSDAELLDLEAASITLMPMAEAYDDTSMAFACDDPDPFEVLCASKDRDLLVRAMMNLPERLQLVLQLFFVEELNLTEIAAVLEVSVPRVHQLRAKALKDLKELLEAELAEDYASPASSNQ